MASRPHEVIEKDLSIIDNITFYEDDWNDVIIACSSLSPKWQRLSEFLGLPIKTIDALKASYPNDPATCWKDALKQWIYQQYNTEKHGLPSWRSLLRAISMVDETLFDTLAQEHQLRGDGGTPSRFSPSMTPIQLEQWLLHEYGSSYKNDISKMNGALINGELFLELPDDKEWLEELKLSGAFKRLITNKVKQIKESSNIIPLCTTANWDEEDICSGTVEPDESMETDEGHAYGDVLSVRVPKNALWDKKELAVKFLNDIPTQWTYGGSKMNVGNIISLANEWNRRGGGTIPKFTRVGEPSAPSDIRIEFNRNRRMETVIGSKATKTKYNQPTMWLDLNVSGDNYKKHLVIHEFGHALGLGHEHQRSDFWKCIKPYVDIAEMKKDLGLTSHPETFRKTWESDSQFKIGKCTAYDPYSIMHYWFNKQWLKNGYSEQSKVERDHDSGVLPTDVAEVLLGVHLRSSISLADKPSEMDIQLLKDLYGNTSCTILQKPVKVNRGVSDDSDITPPTQPPSQDVVLPVKRLRLDSTPSAGAAESLYLDRPFYEEAIEKDLSIIDNTTFDEDDWNDVIIACSSLAPMWQHLSGLLGLPIKTIRTISESYPNDSATSWSQALMQWILQKYNTEKYGSPSWRSLLRAIGMVDKALFNKLAQAHQPRDVVPPVKRLHLDSTPSTGTAESLYLDRPYYEGVVPPAKRLHLDSSSASQETCTFWEMLPSIEVKNQMLNFPAKFRSIKEMFVRDAYDDLYNRYISQCHYVIVTGNPGTGKSYFSVYVLYRLRKERSDLVIVYVSAPSDIVLLFNGDTVSEAKDEKELSSWLDKENTIYLFDAGTRGARIPRVKECKTIVFSSPSRSNYHDFHKECILGPYPGGVMVYMPTWSWDEIDKLCTIKKFETGKVRERFDHWGGIARYIFRRVQECDAAEYANLDEAIENCDPEKIIDLATTLKGGDIKLNSHKILHIHVTNKLPDGSLDYTTAVIYFASDYVVDRVYKKFTANTGKALIDIIDHCEGGWLSGIRGQLFERFAHFSFVNHDTEYDVKCLEPTHSMFNQETKQKFGKLIETPLQNVAALASQKDQKGVYLKPVQQNFESLDAIIPPRVGFQMTVASSHPVKIVGLQKVIKALGCTKEKKFTLYFVVPRNSFKGYKKQSYDDNTKEQKDGSKKAMKIKTDGQKATEEIVEQWVVCMDLTPKL